jgi:transcriptional regulator with XRE-family HTH domain
MRGAKSNREQIRAARISRGLTQEQLAALAELDVKTVRKAEQGKRLDLGSLTRLAHALQSDLSRLIRPGRSNSDREVRRREHIMRWHRLWDAEDSDGLIALYHENAVLHLPGGPNIPFGGTFCGRHEIRQANETAWRTTRTAPARPGDFSLIVTDDSVILEGEKGVWLPSGELIRLGCVQIFTFEGDLIVDHRVEYDTLKFAQLLQLPMEENPPDQPPKSSL